MRSLWLAGTLVAACSAPAEAAFSFTPGHFYTANYDSRDIVEMA